MFYWLKRHPLPVKAFFQHSLVLTYAFPTEALQPLLPPGLVLDTYQDWGFVAVALVQTRDLRPSFLPASFGQSFLLTGYRIFTRLGHEGSSLRGLRILRSDTDRRFMAASGNLMTHYHYHHCQATVADTGSTLSLDIRSADRRADLRVIADLSTKPAPLPAGSPFADLKEARRFAGPLPYTFDYEAETHSIIMVRGIREQWDPQPVAVTVEQASFFEQEPFCRYPLRLANAFHLQRVPYRWERGKRLELAA